MRSPPAVGCKHCYAETFSERFRGVPRCRSASPFPETNRVVPRRSQSHGGGVVAGYALRHLTVLLPRRRRLVVEEGVQSFSPLRRLRQGNQVAANAAIPRATKARAFPWLPGC